MKIKSFNNWSIFAKILSISVITIIPIVLILNILILPEIKQMIFEEKKNQAKNAIDITYSLILEYQDRVDRGEFDLKEGQSRAAKRISKLRYGGGKEYFWINDISHIMIIHPLRPEMVGKDASIIKDADGNRIYEQFVDICKKDTAGFLIYRQLKPGVETPQPKVAYVKLYPKWGWIIGTGIYLESVEQHMIQITRNVYIVSGFAFLFAILFGWYISRRMSRPIKDLEEAARKIALGDTKVNVDYSSEDEIGGLTNSFKTMAQNIREQAQIANSIARGNLNQEIKPRSENDILNISLSYVVKTLNNLVTEVTNITKSAEEGKLSNRGNTALFTGVYKSLVEGINNTLDSLVSPLNMASGYIQRISRGDIPEKITEEYKGDFREIRDSLNVCIDAINALISDTGYIAEMTVAGKLSERADSRKHQGKFKQIIEGIDSTLDSVITPLSVAAEYIDKISKGEIPEHIDEKYNGDFEILISNLNTLVGAIKRLIDDFETQSNNAIKGNYETRADVNRHFGDFRKIVAGVNGTLDAVVDKIFWYEGLLDSIPLPISVTDMNMQWTFINKPVENFLGIKRKDVTGKHCSHWNAAICNTEDCGIAGLRRNKLQTTFNQMGMNFQVDTNYVYNRKGEKIGHIEVVQDVTSKVKIAEYSKVEVERLAGNLSLLSSGNTNLNMIVSEGDDYTKQERENYLKINKTLALVKTAIENLIIDSEMLVESALAGDLKKRAGVEKHQGDYRKIIEGVNSTLDAFLSPLSFAAGFIQKMANGEHLEEVEIDKFRGDFKILMNNLASVRASLNTLDGETTILATAAIEGDLSKRGDSEKAKGFYKEIIEGLNKTLDAILEPIKEGLKNLEKMAQGDLTAHIVSDYKGDHQLIKNSINTVTDSLSRAMNDVREAVDATASASNQISSSTVEMAEGASQQTQQAAEVAGAVEEMTKTILENTRNAAQAANNAKEAGKKALEGGKVVDKTISGMNKIAEVVKKSTDKVQALGRSSDQIGEIAQVIDDIADQTNLLALNAAIEAARAGEQGRGFAVVADEVRKLAERTTKATKEIAEMIKKIQRDTAEAVKAMEEGTADVNEGIKLANQAGVSLKEIIEGSEIVVDIVNQVAAASEQQSSAANEISKSIETISNVTQETATGTGQIAHAAEDLSRLTLNLEKLVNQFKTSGQSQFKQLASHHKS
jgi:methyl-accepting chemotaxis protein